MTREFIPAAKPIIGEEEIQAVVDVMRSGMVVQGPQVKAFEEEFSAKLAHGAESIAVNSGTSAQHLATLASELKSRGNGAPEVIVPSFTFAATGNSVAISGANPVFADIDPVTFTLDPASVEASITKSMIFRSSKTAHSPTALPLTASRLAPLGAGDLSPSTQPRT